MARARNIKPKIMANEYLADLSTGTRLLFIYLWMLADREGRLEDRPRRIGGQALPYDRDIDVDESLQQLHDAGFILRYEVDGGKYIQILTFSEHQNPHCKEQESTIPAPGMHSASTGHAHGDEQASTGKTEKGECVAPPDSLIPDSGFSDTPPNPPSGGKVDPEGFAEFWEQYPRKVAKENARKAWRRQKVKPGELSEILKALQAARASEQWCRDGGKFIPHPATWLNGRRWEDEESPQGEGGELSEWDLAELHAQQQARERAA